MTGEPLSALLDLAEELEAPVTDKWGKTSIEAAGGIDDALLSRVLGLAGLTVTAFFGDSRDELVLDERVPYPADVSPLLPLAPNERVASELQTARATEIARMLIADLVALEVAFVRPSWIRTVDAFLEEVGSDWLRVAEGISDVVTIGDATFDMVRVGRDDAPDRPTVYAPSAPEPPAAPPNVWRLLERIADASSWVNLARSVKRSEAKVEIGLIRDEPPRRVVDLENSDGGTELLGWVTATDDANRMEALDYVLMLVSASSTEKLPSATTVQRLAERERKALTSKQAAEVHRAIAEGQRDATDTLARASSDVGNLVEETMRNVNAALLAVLGLVLLFAREPGMVPLWLVALVAGIAVGGIWLVVVSRAVRLRDHQRSIEHLVARLEGDPLLPKEDCETALGVIEEFDVNRRVARARRSVVALGAGASIVAVAAALWMGFLSPQTETKTGEMTPSPAPNECPAETRRPAGPRP